MNTLLRYFLRYIYICNSGSHEWQANTSHPNRDSDLLFQPLIYFYFIDRRVQLKRRLGPFDKTPQSSVTSIHNNYPEVPQGDLWPYTSRISFESGLQCLWHRGKLQLLQLQCHFEVVLQCVLQRNLPSGQSLRRYI